MTLKLLKYRERLFHKPVWASGAAAINEYNSADFKKRRDFKKLYRPVERHITAESFIIPMPDGQAIGAYLFRRHSRKSDTQNSLIVYFHEGGWVFGNMDVYCAICSNICNTTGSMVLAVDYRLAPAFRFPVPVEDCYNAYLWALQGARYWKVDPSRIYLMGSCAGGNLAIAVSRLARDGKVTMPAGLVLIEPITDCRLRTDSLEKYRDNPMLSEKDLNFFISSYMREPKDILDPLFSPLLAIDNSRLPETLIIAAEIDPLFDDAKLYSEVLMAADTPVRFMVCEGRLHGMLNYPSSHNWAGTMEEVTQFVNGRSVSTPNLKS